MLLDKTILMMICAPKSHNSPGNNWFAAEMLLFVAVVRLCVSRPSLASLSHE
jgi:hypothetical protein